MGSAGEAAAACACARAYAHVRAMLRLDANDSRSFVKCNLTPHDTLKSSRAVCVIIGPERAFEAR